MDPYLQNVRRELLSSDFRLTLQNHLLEVEGFAGVQPVVGCDGQEQWADRCKAEHQGYDM